MYKVKMVDHKVFTELDEFATFHQAAEHIVKLMKKSHNPIFLIEHEGKDIAEIKIDNLVCIDLTQDPEEAHRVAMGRANDQAYYR